jgi:hypothetical protein
MRRKVMEFFEISGTVKLAPEKMDEAFCRLVHRIQNVVFEDGGVMLVIHEDDELTIEGNGEVSDPYSAIELFRRLNEYLADDSYMTINRARWECYVQLHVLHKSTNWRSLLKPELTLVEA